MYKITYYQSFNISFSRLNLKTKARGFSVNLYYLEVTWREREREVIDKIKNCCYKT